MNRLKVYIAAPYTAGDPCVNTHAAIEAGDELLSAGLAPWVPHLSHFWHTMHPHPWEEWIELDLAWLPAADALLRLPGESKGADREAGVAFDCGIPIFYTVQAVIEWKIRKECHQSPARKEGEK